MGDEAGSPLGRRAQRYSGHFHENCLGQVGAAIDWLQAIEEKFSLLAAQPHAGDRKVLPSGKEARVVPFGNYLIYFKPMPDGVAILRVWHGARGHDPRI